MTLLGKQMKSGPDQADGRSMADDLTDKFKLSLKDVQYWTDELEARNAQKREQDCCEATRMLLFYVRHLATRYLQLIAGQPDQKALDEVVARLETAQKLMEWSRELAQDSSRKSRIDRRVRMLAELRQDIQPELAKG